MKDLHMVIDVETMGLYGAPFSVAAVVVNSKGEELESIMLTCNREYVDTMDEALDFYGSSEQCFRDAEWVKKNVPTVPTEELVEEDQMYLRFYSFFLRWKDKCNIWADCPYPCETGFFLRMKQYCLNNTLWFDLYPLLDVTSIVFATGRCPLTTFGRLPQHLPEHNPLNDARHSASLLTRFLDQLGTFQTLHHYAEHSS